MSAALSQTPAADVNFVSWRAVRHDPLPTDQSLPARYIAPVGAGTPAAGSSVIAKVSTALPARIGATRRLPTPLASTLKTPAGTGAPAPAMAQSSAVLTSRDGG